MSLTLKDLRSAVAGRLKDKQIFMFTFLFKGDKVDQSDEENYPIEDTAEENKVTVVI